MLRLLVKRYTWKREGASKLWQWQHPPHSKSDARHCVATVELRLTCILLKEDLNNHAHGRPGTSFWTWLARAGSSSLGCFYLKRGQLYWWCRLNPPQVHAVRTLRPNEFPSLVVSRWIQSLCAILTILLLERHSSLFQWSMRTLHPPLTVP